MTAQRSGGHRHGSPTVDTGHRKPAPDPPSPEFERQAGQASGCSPTRYRHQTLDKQSTFGHPTRRRRRHPNAEVQVRSTDAESLTDLPGSSRSPSTHSAPTTNRPGQAAVPDRGTGGPGSRPMFRKHPWVRHPHAPFPPTSARDPTAPTAAPQLSQQRPVLAGSATAKSVCSRIRCRRCFRQYVRPLSAIVPIPRGGPRATDPACPQGAVGHVRDAWLLPQERIGRAPTQRCSSSLFHPTAMAALGVGVRASATCR